MAIFNMKCPDCTFSCLLSWLCYRISGDKCGHFQRCSLPGLRPLGALHVQVRVRGSGLERAGGEISRRTEFNPNMRRSPRDGRSRRRGSPMTRPRLAVDIGGTFTDVAVERDGACHTGKVLTHPRRPGARGPRRRPAGAGAGGACAGRRRRGHPRDHAGDQRADRAPGGHGRGHRHRGIPRHPRNRL